MKKIAIVWGLLAIFLVGTLTYIGVQYEESVGGYQALEQDMIESASIYITKEKIEMKVNETLRIKAKELINTNCLESMEVEEDICDGYVLVKRKKTGYEYKAFIRCKDYTSVDFEN